MGQEQCEVAMTILQQAREMLHTLESEVCDLCDCVRCVCDDVRCVCDVQGGYLSMLCYNIGLDLFQKNLYQHSVNWLK